MNEKKQPQDEVTLDETEQSNRRKIETCFSTNLSIVNPLQETIDTSFPEQV